MYLCYQEPEPGYISKLISARRACHLGSCIAYSSSSPVFISPLPAALVLASLRRSCFFPGGPIPSRPLLFLYRLARPPRGPQLSVSPGGPMPSRPLLYLYCLARPPRGPKLSVSPGGLMPSRLLLFLYHLAHVHQEDRSSSLAGSRPLLKNVLTNALSVSSQHFDCHHHLPRSIFVAQVT